MSKLSNETFMSSESFSACVVVFSNMQVRKLRDLVEAPLIDCFL